MSRQEESMRLRKSEKEKLLHTMYTNFLRTLEDRVRQRVLQTSANRVFWNGNSPDLLKAFVGFVGISSEKTATS